MLDILSPVKHEDNNGVVECKPPIVELPKLGHEEGNVGIIRSTPNLSKVIMKEVVIIDNLDNNSELGMVTTTSSSFKSTSNAGNSSGENQNVILSYPFVGGDCIEKAAKGLKLPTWNETEVTYDQLILQQVEASTGRVHILTMYADDRDRLSPGKFLNDTLINFWMKWYYIFDCSFLSLSITFVYLTNFIFIFI